MDPSADDGAFQLYSPFNSNYYNSPNNYHLEVEVSTTPADYSDTVDLISGVNGSVVESAGGNIYQGTSTVTPTLTPAPIPGSGLLSYLAFGFGGLFIYRKRLSPTVLAAGSAV